MKKEPTMKIRGTKGEGTMEIEMSADTMQMMVDDWLFDHADEVDDLVLDGKPRYDEDLASWVQDAHDSTNSYLLIAHCGSIDIEYSGTF